MENPSNIVPDQLIVLEGDAGLVPKASSGDVGKVLGVLNSSGDVGWVPDQEGMAQVQADWDQTDSSQVSYIANKPDLSVYATTSAMNTALASKQDTISDLADIRSGAAKGDTAVQPAALNDYATTSAMNTALAGKQNVISDLSDIRSGASLGATSVQPSALDSYATTSAMNTALAGKQDVINDLADIRSGASAGSTAVQPAALEDYATISAMNTALAGKQNTISDLDSIRAGAAAGATAAQPSDLPSSDELVPSATSGDSGKVLTVNSSGNAEWAPAQGGGSSYTATAPISIESDVIKLKYNGDFTKGYSFDLSAVTGKDGFIGMTSVLSFPGFPPYYSAGKFCLVIDTTEILSWAPIEITGSEMSVSTGWTIVAYKQESPTTDYMFAKEVYAYDAASTDDRKRIAGHGQDVKYYTFTFNTASIHGDVSNTPLCFAIVPNPADSISGSSPWGTPYLVMTMGNVEGIFKTNTLYNDAGVPSGTGTLVADVLALQSAVKVPSYSSADAGKVLQVQNDGTLAWVTLS